jgi:hypothetical protein
MTRQKLPKGWSEDRVRKVIDYYDSLTEEEWLAEDEAARGKKGYTTVVVPDSLLPEVRKLLAAERKKKPTRKVASKR